MMSKLLQNSFSISILSFFYLVQLFHNVIIGNNIINMIIHKMGIVSIAIFVLVLIGLLKTKSMHFSIILKIIVFIILFLCYFIGEQIFIKLIMYSIGDSGGIIRTRIIGDTFYQFQWYEVLFWNFIFSLHYPVYIFIFFKPFVNHLDKSIQKIKENSKNV